jgi:hydroxyethylthiazole kinase-like uncharacterized protein yjeF
MVTFPHDDSSLAAIRRTARHRIHLPRRTPAVDGARRPGCRRPGRWNFRPACPAGPLLLAGPGNNGGDAFVVARLMKAEGLDPLVFFSGQRDSLPADAQRALEQWLAVGSIADQIPTQHFGLVVDGLFGIGIKHSRPLAEPYLSLIARINAYAGPVLALDCPSGLDADTGTVNPLAVKATHTITFIALKPGLLTLDGPDHCGAIMLADLGLADNVENSPGAGRPQCARTIRRRPAAPGA